MTTPQTQIPETLVEALAKLKLDPSRSVRAHLDELDVELRAVVPPSRRRCPGLGTRMAALGPRQGECAEEIIRIPREGREAGGNAERPCGKR